jgi:hypothetical protein
MRRILGVAAMLVVCAFAGATQAAVYTWKITGGFTGSGSFTTQNTPSDSSGADSPNTGLAYLLTSFTGTFAGKTVQLAPNPGAAPYFADDLFYPTGHYPFVDVDGILFQTLTAAGAVAQIYNLFDSQTCGAGGCSEIARIGYPGIPGGSKAITFSFTTVTPPSVPEPATWGLMIGGFGLAGAALRRHRRGLAAA